LLKFFRKIRQEVLVENKISKYLIYAIGEIVLVVIGILIALKVNDLNEKMKFQDQEQLYIAKMHEDLQIINDYMHTDILGFPEKIQEAQLTLYMVQYCEMDSASAAIFQKTLITAGNLGKIYVRDATYTEMLANGSFSRMTNDSIKNRISDIYDQLDYLNESISYFRSELGEANKIIWNHIEKEFKSDLTEKQLSENQITTHTEDQIIIKYQLEELCASRKFKNALVEIIDSRKDVYANSLNVFQNLSTILELLNSEIHGNKESNSKLGVM